MTTLFLPSNRTATRCAHQSQKTERLLQGAAASLLASDRPVLLYPLMNGAEEGFVVAGRLLDDATPVVMK